MNEILLVFGTRPEAIKLCPLLPPLREAGFALRVAVSDQHRTLLSDALAAFSVTPAHTIRAGHRGQSPGEILSAVLRGTEALIRRHRPALLLVHGDTATACGAALGGFLSGVAVGHVEAGLRTGNLQAPFPEEFFRRLITQASTLHFAPTAQARANLLREGVAPSAIKVTGNTAIDALALTYRPHFTHPVLQAAAGHKLVIVTLHRRESRGAVMQGLFAAVRQLSDECEEAFFYCPLHPAPAVRAASAPLRGHPRILAREPEGPLVFHNLLARCYMVMTDSGGLQEEAPYFHKPVLVLRQETERAEGVAAGVLRVAADPAALVREGRCLLREEEAYRRMAEAESPFGDGHAAARIAAHLAAHFGTSG